MIVFIISSKLYRYSYSAILVSVLLFLQYDSHAQSRLVGEPIPGVGVKVGRKPPGGNNIIASGKTDENGEVEFKNIPTDADSIFFIFEIPQNENQKPQAQRWSIPSLQFENNEKAVAKPVVKKFPEFVVTITEVPGEKLRGTPIVTSRSNIKQMKITVMSSVRNMK